MQHHSRLYSRSQHTADKKIRTMRHIPVDGNSFERPACAFRASFIFILARAKEKTRSTSRSDVPRRRVRVGGWVGGGRRRGERAAAHTCICTSTYARDNDDSPRRFSIPLLSRLGASRANLRLRSVCVCVCVCVCVYIPLRWLAYISYV